MQEEEKKGQERPYSKWYVKTCSNLFQDAAWVLEETRRYNNEDQRIEIGEMGIRERERVMRILVV